MSGASRNERQRRQQAADQRLAAAGITPKKRAPAGNRTALIVVAAVVAIAVVVGVVYAVNRSKGGDVAASYPVTASGTIITAGSPSAPVTVDIYEDYLCPICERFESSYGPQLTQALNQGKIKVNYHATAILDGRTTPPGYSTLAANAGLCAVPAGIWPAFHKKLYDEQPAENSAGYTAAQLVEKGNALGAAPGFEQCVSANANAGAITKATVAAEKTPALTTNGSFGTPTVAIGGKKVDLTDGNWLRNAIGA